MRNPFLPGIPARLGLPLMALIAAVLALQPWTAPASSAAGYASAGLALTVVPPVLIADATVQRALYVQLTDGGGNPMLAVEDTVVSIVPSDSSIIAAPAEVVIRPGESYETVPLTTSSLPGNALITAVSQGRASASVEVTTVSAFDANVPVRLALHAAPMEMIEGRQFAGKLAVVLLDDEGRAVPADRPLEVVLTSSAPDVVRVPEQVVIRVGEHFAVTDLTSLGVGSASISATRSGSVSESLEVQVVRAGDEATALLLEVMPPTLTAGAGIHEGLLIWAVDDDGKPAPVPCTQIHMASSVPQTLDVAPVLDMECNGERPYVLTSVDVGFTPGEAELSAAATGLLRASSLETVQGRAPAQLKAYIAPAVPLRIDARPAIAVVEVLDDQNVPVTSHSGIPITLVGGGETLHDVLVIPPGRSFAALNLPRPVDTQEVNWWVTSPGLTAAPLSGSYVSLPVTVQLLATERPLFPGDEIEVRAVVRSQGRPLPDARLTWSSTQGTLHDASERTDESGTGLARYRAATPNDGNVRVTVDMVGFQSASANVATHVVAGTSKEDSETRILGMPVSYLFAIAASGLVLFFAYQFSHAFRSWVRSRLPWARSDRDPPPEPTGRASPAPATDRDDSDASEAPGPENSARNHAVTTDLDGQLLTAEAGTAGFGPHQDQPDEVSQFPLDARRSAAEPKSDQDRLPGASGRPTLASFATEWLDSIRMSLKPKTLESYEWALRLHVLPQLGEVTLADLNPSHVQRLYAEVMAAGLSPKSARNIHHVVHAMLERAVRLDLIPSNVAHLVDRPRAPHRELPVLTQDQARSLVEAARDHRLRALFVLAVTTGARSGELLGLTWDDIDLDNAAITIKKTLQKQGDSIRLIETNTARSRRKVAIPRLAVEALRWHRARQAEESLALGPAWRNVLNLVFTTRLGTPLDQRNVLRREFRPLLKSAGLPETLRFHDLRHIAAALALGKGMPVPAVSEMLGHADSATTLRVYAHAVPGTQRQVADAMEAALGA